jgi:translation elongation factor EF-1beta
MLNQPCVLCNVTAKLVPLAYGIRKLQISSVVEDDKVSVDELQEKIEGFEDLVRLTLAFLSVPRV